MDTAPNGLDVNEEPNKGAIQYTIPQIQESFNLSFKVQRARSAPVASAFPGPNYVIPHLTDDKQNELVDLVYDFALSRVSGWCDMHEGDDGAFQAPK